MKEQPLVAGLGGSLRETSYSRAVLKAALHIAEVHGAMTELLDVRELDLLFFVPDLPVGAYPMRYQPSINSPNRSMPPRFRDDLVFTHISWDGEWRIQKCGGFSGTPD